MCKKLQQGFTLIELIMVMFIASILISIVYQSYVTLTMKSRRSDALVTLAQVQLILEHCYIENSSYNPCDFSQISNQGHYSIHLSHVGPSTYILKATAIGSQTQDTMCAHFIVNQANVKTAIDDSGTIQSACWKL